MKHVFTLQRLHLRVGSVALVVFSSALVVSVLFLCTEVSSNGASPAILFFSLPWLLFVGISIWVLLAYWRAELTLNDDEVTMTGVFHHRRFRLAEVTRANWRLAPVSLKLWFRGGEVVLWIDNFRPACQVQLFRYFRERLAPEIQAGWSEVFERYASEVESNQFAAESEFGRVIRLVTWTNVLAGPVVGVILGVVLYAFAAYLGVQDVPTWTGSLLLDWIVGGTVAGFATVAVLQAILRGLKWMLQPDSGP